MKGKIESQAQQEMSDAQRQYYLRQQLKAIRQELGEGDDGNDTSDIRARIEKARLPDHVSAAVLREVDRLEQMPQASPEYQMVRTYIDWVLEIPWTTITEDRLDPGRGERACSTRITTISTRSRSVSSSTSPCGSSRAT